MTVHEFEIRRTVYKHLMFPRSMTPCCALRHALLAYAPAIIANFPSLVPVLGNCDVLRAGKRLFIKRVGDKLPGRVAEIPTFKNLFDI